MSTFCKVTIVGNLGNDPETKRFDNGGQLTNLSVATTENWKDKNTGEKKSITEWNRVVMNGKLSEIAEKYLKKGDKVLIEGKLRTRKWTDQASVDHYTTEIICRELVMLSSKSGGSDNSVPANSRQPEHAGDQFLKGLPKEEEEDLPF